MKKIVVALVVMLLALSAPTLALDTLSTIGGYGIGHGVAGFRDGQTFTFAFGGAKIWSLGSGSIYTVYQYGAVNGLDVGGYGGAIMYAEPFKIYPDLKLVADLGVLNNIALNADGELVPGLTIGAGVTWTATENMGLDAWMRAWDTGPSFSAIAYGALHLRNPTRLLRPIFGTLGGVL